MEQIPVIHAQTLHNTTRTHKHSFNSVRFRGHDIGKLPTGTAALLMHGAEQRKQPPTTSASQFVGRRLQEVVQKLSTRCSLYACMHETTLGNFLRYYILRILRIMIQY